MDFHYETNKQIDFQLLKFLRGNFYSEDHDKVCRHENVPDDEIYVSDDYPEVHGKCGRWMKPYE